MKNNHGNKLLLIITFLLLSNIVLFASTYKWSASSNKQIAYTNEAIYLKYTCEFSDASELYVIEFNPQSTQKFDIKLLSETEHIKNSQRINTYEFVVFAKVAGVLSFNFDVLMKKTNKDSIENTVLGRDNAQFEEYTNKLIKQKTLRVNIKEAKVDLVGSFSINIKKDKPNVQAFEPYHLQISIEGIGNFQALHPYEFKFLHAKVHFSKPHKEYKLTKDGYKGVWFQKFAIVSDVNFTIPHVDIDYLDLAAKQIKTLQIQQETIGVTQAYIQEDLLDDIQDNSFVFKYEYLYYFLTFIAGFLLAKIKFKVSKIENKTDLEFIQKVKKATNLEEFLRLLVISNSKKYAHIISKIEKGAINSLSDAKNLI